MICPILYVADKPTEKMWMKDRLVGRCLEERCEWWSIADKSCAVRILAEKLKEVGV